MIYPRRAVSTLLGALVFLPMVVTGAVFAVVNSDPTGPGSFAQAVSDANSAPGPHQIVFAIPGPGVHKIDLRNTFIQVGSSITIDGYTQPGASPNTLTVGDNAVILIQLDGGGPFASQTGGLYLIGDDSVIRGLSLTGFAGPIESMSAIYFAFTPTGANRNRIEGNFIGLEPDGVTLRGNNNGIYFDSGGGSDNVIGGNTPAARNIISGNETGIYWAINSTIIGNYLGTDATGLRQGYGNNTGIFALQNNNIGTGEPGGQNVITGGKIGISVIGVSGPGWTTIRGNLIGPNADGSPSFGNEIGIQDTVGRVVIGGTGPGEGNVIAFNARGALVGGFEGPTSILSSLFYGNSLIDIDQAFDWSTPNDYGDQDRVQNFPVILSVARNPGETVVSGGLNSAPTTSFVIQFFANGATSGSPQTLLGTETVTTNNFGDALFTFSFPIPTSTSQFITATATGPEGSSEFFPSNGTVAIANISTRGYVGTGDEVLIGGSIRRQSSSRTLLIRALGPSLNISGALANPKLVVRRSSGEIIAQNDNWKTGQEQQIRDTGLAPSSDLEAATLTPLGYGPNLTVEVSGSDGGVGIGSVEIYEIPDPTYSGPGDLLNISTRGRVGTGDNALIGGTIINGSAPQKVIVRAIGPDLGAAGVANPLQDPTLELRDAAGTLLAANDDWRSDHEQEIIATGLAPQDSRDSAIVMTLLPTAYTAIVRGKGGATGIALVEIYNLN